MVAKKKRVDNYIEYEDLRDTWWIIHRSYEWCKDEGAREYLTRLAFEVVLEQCGWTVSDWNDENDRGRR